MKNIKRPPMYFDKPYETWSDQEKIRARVASKVGGLDLQNLLSKLDDLKQGGATYDAMVTFADEYACRICELRELA